MFCLFFVYIYDFNEQDVQYRDVAMFWKKEGWASLNKNYNPVMVYWIQLWFIMFVCLAME